MGRWNGRIDIAKGREGKNYIQNSTQRDKVIEYVKKLRGKKIEWEGLIHVLSSFQKYIS